MLSFRKATVIRRYVCSGSTGLQVPILGRHAGNRQQLTSTELGKRGNQSSGVALTRQRYADGARQALWQA